MTWQSVNLWSCKYQKNTSRSCKINLIHHYQDVIHQHWHNSLCQYSHYRVICTYQRHSMYHCAVYVQTVRYMSASSVCVDGTVRVSMQFMCRRYGTCQHAVYVQTVWYVSACSVCADGTVHVSMQCMCNVAFRPHWRKVLLRCYDLYQRLQLQFYVLLMMGVDNTRNM